DLRLLVGVLEDLHVLEHRGIELGVETEGAWLGGADEALAVERERPLPRERRQGLGREVRSQQRGGMHPRARWDELSVRGRPRIARLYDRHDANVAFVVEGERRRLRAFERDDRFSELRKVPRVRNPVFLRQMLEDRPQR